MNTIIKFITDYYYVFIILSVFMVISLLGYNIMDGRSRVKDDIRDLPEDVPNMNEEPVQEQNIM